MPFVRTDSEEPWERVVKLVKWVSKTTNDDSCQQSLFDRMMREPSIIAIHGERGMGKTYTIAKSMTMLDQDSFIVCAPLFPTLFAESDTLLTIVLRTLSVALKNVTMADDARLQLESNLSDAISQVALNALPLERTLTAASSVVELAREHLKIAVATQKMWDDVADIFSTIKEETGRLVVFAIDDFDLVGPHMIERLTNELYSLAICPNVAVIVAACDADLDLAMLSLVTPQDNFPDALTLLSRERDNFPDAYASMLLSRERDERNAASAARRKIFPVWGQVILPDPTVRQVLDFTPPGESVSLFSLLQRISQGDKPSESSGGWLVDALNLNAKPFASSNARGNDNHKIWPSDQRLFPLPRNYRKLTQIYQALTRIEKQDTKVDSLAVAKVLLSMVDVPYGAKTPPSLSETMGTVVYDFSGLYEIKKRGPYISINTNSCRIKTSVQLSEGLDSSTAWFTDFTAPNPISQSSDFALVLALQGALRQPEYVIDDWSCSKAAGFDNSTTRFFQRIKFMGETADAGIIALPISTDLRTIWLTVVAWNTIVVAAREKNWDIFSVGALICQAALAIFGEQRAFDLSSATRDYPEALTDIWKKVKSLTTTGKTLIYQPADVPEAHFLDWCRWSLPRFWHDALFTNEQIAKFVNDMPSWLRAVDISLSGFNYIGNGLEGILKSQLGATGKTDQISKNRWLGGYSAAVQAFGISLPDSWNAIVDSYRARIATATIGQQAVARSNDGSIDNFSDPDEATTPMMTHIVSEDET